MNVQTVCLFLGVVLFTQQLSKGFRMPSVGSFGEDDQLIDTEEAINKRQIETQRMARVRYCLTSPQARFDISCWNLRRKPPLRVTVHEI